jgi:MFS transporter, DHA1 family, multidrug resistance protein
LQNWSQKKKFWTAFLIDVYTFVVYASSSIYISSELLIMERFHVQEFKAALGLALYVLGYGIGPLIFSPLSEVPAFGRNLPYITTFALFTILSVPLALVDNLGGLLVLRFLLGFFGSPCLATGGASMGVSICRTTPLLNSD